MFSRYCIPLGMYRSVENEVPAESSHSVGMQPCDLPNGGIPTECSCVGTSFSTERCKPTACCNAQFTMHNDQCEL
ncbi:MAG: hypothetical protein LBQ66_13370 [Planctomycetaceae bacterium]|jgi:hypothetical protein|nr:hypothetical protein [Planctomycetaceae bacterium]